MVDVAASSAFIMGKPVKELETELAEYVGVKHCISCGNGTDALTLALKVWNIGAGDAVFVPDFTFFSSAEVISLEGATPVFVDVDRETFNMDASDLERKIARTIEEGRLTPKVIITVDLFGLPANYPAIRKIADAHRLFILEDGAQGFGGMIGNKRACSFGDISTTSFSPPSLWVVTATAERCSPITTNGLRWQILTGYTAKACSSTITSASA